MSYPPPPPGEPGRHDPTRPAEPAQPPPAYRPGDPVQPPPDHQAADPAQPPPTFQPGMAPLPPQYDPTAAFPPYAAPPRAPGGGSTFLLWGLIAVFAILLCAGAGIAGVIAYRNGADERGSASPTTEPAPQPGPGRQPTEPPDDPTDEPTTAPSGEAGGVVTYEVTGDGPASITYLKGASLGNEVERSAALPWQVEVEVPENTFLVSLIALRKESGDGSITCRVLFNGEEVVSKTSEGPFATVACIDLVFD